MLFDEHGYHKTSMDDIAQAAGLTKPALYYYTRSKGELIYLIHDQLAEMLWQRLSQRRSDGVPATDNLREVVYDTISVLESHPGHMRVFFENFRDLPEDYRQEVSKKRDRYYGAVLELIHDGVKSGDLETDDPRLTALAFHGMANWSYQWYRANGRVGLQEIADHLWNFAMFGMSTEVFRASVRTGPDDAS